MVFSSFTFLFAFFPVVVLCYFLAKNTAVRNIILLVASLCFYAWGEPVYLLLMLASIVVNWLLGLGLEKIPQLKKAILVLACVINLSSLGFFKYSDFILINLNKIPNVAFSLFHLSLPLGISFYTFQALSYVIDVYRGKVKVQKNLWYFALYISMFPQLIAGPIVCYEEVQEQLTNRVVDEKKIAHGIFRFVIGLSKKVILANQAGKIWESLGTDSIVLSWMGALFYAFQIYFDFSGYSDMAIGLGEIFGFTFPENFNYPYIARSITQFWRRWHKTLSGWFLNYLYIPLGGSREGKVKMLRNLLIVWFLTGLWHGAGWNFILWGLYFFVLLSIEKLFLLPILEKIPRVFSHLYTIFFLLIGWMIFASDGVHLKTMFVGDLMSANTFYELKSNGIFLLILAICSLPIKQLKRVRECSEKMKFCIKTVVSLVLLFTCIAFLVGDAYNPFLYFRF